MNSCGGSVQVAPCLVRKVTASSVHDARAVDESQPWKRGHCRMNRAPKMDIHRILEIVDGHLLQRADLHDAGVVDEDIDVAVVLTNAGDGFGDLVLVFDVSRDRKDARAAMFQFVFGFDQFHFVAGDESDLGAFFGEFAGEDETEPA